VSWKDMGLYWAWSGDGFVVPPTPTVKKIDYVRVCGQCLAIGVFDDETYTPLNRAELEFLAGGWADI
jgi:hypothetical protein